MKKLALAFAAAFLLLLAGPGVRIASANVFCSDNGNVAPCCGNNIVESGEQCDGSSYQGGSTCADQAGAEYTQGSLSCGGICDTINTQACQKAASSSSVPTGSSIPTGSTIPTAAAGTTAPPLSSILSNVPSPLDPSGHVPRGNLSALIKGITTIRGAAGFLLAFGLSFVGVVALLIVVMAGYRYITAFGGDTAKAKGAIASVVIGIIIIVGAWALVTTAINAFGPTPLNLPI